MKAPTQKDKEQTSNNAAGFSPGKRIEYQEKLLNQVDLLYKMFERGAIIQHQFEKRREVLLTQLDTLSS